MTLTCRDCEKTIEPEDDEHYSCDCDGEYKAYCPTDGMTRDCCPVCGEKLKYHEASLTKRAFEDPGLRGLLGF